MDFTAFSTDTSSGSPERFRSPTASAGVLASLASIRATTNSPGQDFSAFLALNGVFPVGLRGAFTRMAGALHTKGGHHFVFERNIHRAWGGGRAPPVVRPTTAQPPHSFPVRLVAEE